MFLNSSSASMSNAESALLRRIEHKLDLILKHLNIAVPAEPNPTVPAQWPIEIRQPADAGRKIESIKAHRDLFGSTLREAKDAIEAYMGE
jgi:ribosomal protein L7/L12